MLRRLHHEQPDGFAFTEANAAWAERLISRYPEGRQASAVIPLLWRGQEQEGWVSRPMIETVAGMLGMAEIRVLEVATFYFMFQLRPVGEVAHVQVCGTTSCMICGAEDLIGVCQRKIAAAPHQLSEDGKFSWEEVECLGACSNAPMVQIGKDYYEDLTEESFEAILDAFAKGEVPRPGPQNGRWASEPVTGFSSLEGDPDHEANASVHLADELGDTIRRIDGSERTASDLLPGGEAVPQPEGPAPREEPAMPKGRAKGKETEHDAEEAKGWPEEGTVAPGPVKDPHAAAPGKTGAPTQPARPTARPAAGPGPVEDLTPEGDPETEDHGPVPDYDGDGVEEGEDEGTKPDLLTKARDGGADNLKEIKGIGPKLEKLLHKTGVYHFDQIANWTKDEVAWVDANLKGFKGRVTRDDWVGQARTLASGGETEFSKRVEAGEVESSKGKKGGKGDA